jgi:NADH-quinone oxidoreductase subunit L
MTRLMAMTFWGGERFREAHAGGQADEAHAHAHDEGAKPHDAHAPSAGDRPHHAPGEHVDTDAHAAVPHAAGAHGSHGHGADDSIFVEEDEHDGHAHHGPVEPHESPWVMTVPLVVLAVLSTVGGLVGIPYALSSLVGLDVPNYFERALEPVVAHAPERHAASDSHGAAVTPAGEAEHGARPATAATATDSRAQPQPHGAEADAPAAIGEGAKGAPAAEHAAHDPAEVRAERIFSGISLFIAGVGIGVGILLFGKRPLLKMPRLLENKYYVDEAYDAAVINPIRSGSREGLWKVFDVGVIDGLVNGAARGSAGLGGVVRRIQLGFVRSYAAIILLGALLVVAYFIVQFGLTATAR